MSTQYETVNGWTKESMVEHIKANFKGKSYEDNYASWAGESCLYRGPNGKKCAVGLFIPDAVYSKNMENRNVLMLREVEKSFPLKVETMFELQGVHDNSDSSVTLQSMLDWIEENVK